MPVICLAALPGLGCSALFTSEAEAERSPDGSVAGIVDGSVFADADSDPASPDAQPVGPDAGNLVRLLVVVESSIGGQVVLTNYEPAGTFCNASMPCEVFVEFGTPIALLASPNDFAGWSIGPCPHTTNAESAQLSLIEDCTAKAAFSAQ
jgi:hypothetical protein